MKENGIVVSYLMLELADGFQEWLALNITDGSSDFDNRDMCIFGSEIPIETAFDLIGDVWDNLHGSSAVITAALLLKNRPVNLTGCYVGIFIKTLVDEALIMSQIKIGFGSIVGDEHLTVLYWIHGTRVNINIRIEFLHGYFITACFQKTAQRCGSDSLAES